MNTNLKMRPLVDPELDIVMQTLISMRAKNPTKHMMHADPATARAYIEQAIADNRCYIVNETYFVMFEVGNLWFTNQPLLLEQLVLRVYHNTGIPPHYIPDALMELAKFFGATAAVVGDTQVGAMLPHYIAANFTPIGGQLFKEV